MTNTNTTGMDDSRQADGASRAHPRGRAACCDAETQTRCCEPVAKATCCGPSHAAGCGCRDRADARQ